MTVSEQKVEIVRRLLELTQEGLRSEAPVEMHTASIYRLDSRQVVRVDIFLDPAKALEAAGLPQ